MSKVVLRDGNAKELQPVGTVKSIYCPVQHAVQEIWKDECNWDDLLPIPI